MIDVVHIVHAVVLKHLRPDILASQMFCVHIEMKLKWNSKLKIGMVKLCLAYKPSHVSDGVYIKWSQVAKIIT